jgi:hypothetical protein
MLKLHLVGDSNVDRYISIVKTAKEDPAIQETSFVRATNLVQVKRLWSLPAPASHTPTSSWPALPIPLLIIRLMSTRRWSPIVIRPLPRYWPGFKRVASLPLEQCDRYTFCFMLYVGCFVVVLILQN